MRTVGERASDTGSAPRPARPAPPDEPPAAVQEGLGLVELAAILEALGSSELAAVFEALDACDAEAVDAASAWLRARSRAWMLCREAWRARAAVAATADPFARMLLRREAVAAAREHAEADQTLLAAEARLADHLGPARAATLQRALARLQDVPATPPPASP
jgi:hypothetical protein